MDMTLSLKAIAAFVFVMGLMYLLSWGIRKLGLNGQSLLPGAKRRLKIVEYLPLDARRRLVLVRRDQKEFLLVLGPQGETVVEGNIPAPADNIVELAEHKELKNG
ncbi:MAG: flagellar biosynthetic protein FliO [Alphaproteobacteria bacterium]